MTAVLEPPITTSRPTAESSGVLDITRNGTGHLRGPDYLPTPYDVQVPTALIRRHGLRPGDVVHGTGARQLSRVDLLHGRPPRELADRPRFADLTPVHPRSRLRMETSRGTLATRVVDLLAPVGKGQRGLIAAPPKTGKTVLLRQLADAVVLNHPECHLMVLLLDERPEEVTEMRRAVRGEVLASTFDRSPAHHVALADLALERAKRLVEQGEDVVLLLDSLTRLCRAHNHNASSGGRTLSGGVDAGAVLGPKRFFGAARQTEEAGSLTILATALVETGSRADDYFFEELKSTGNMELRLTRSLADKRVFPALDIAPSGTRRTELLVPAADLSTVWGLRRALLNREGGDAYTTLLERLRATPDNAAFLRAVRGTVPEK